jgi:hypothetical protein
MIHNESTHGMEGLKHEYVEYKLNNWGGVWIIWEEMIQEMFNQHIILQFFHQWTIVLIKKNIVPQPNTLLSNEHKALETS